jgi:hypothetical protein
VRPLAKAPSRALLIYLQMLTYDAPPGLFIDVRWCSARHPMRRRALPASDVACAARRIELLSKDSDVFVGVALRDSRAHGGKAAIPGSRYLFIECDHPDATARLAAFAFPPSMIVASGAPGHLHAYWRLTAPACGVEVERANRRLVRLLGGDPACVDLARVLRPPGTLNYKHDPPAPVLLCDCRDAAYALGELTAGLPEDPALEAGAPARLVSRWVIRSELERELRSIPAIEYARVLSTVPRTLRERFSVRFTWRRLRVCISTRMGAFTASGRDAARAAQSSTSPGTCG